MNKVTAEALAGKITVQFPQVVTCVTPDATIKPAIPGEGYIIGVFDGPASEAETKLFVISSEYHWNNIHNILSVLGFVAPTSTID